MGAVRDLGSAEDPDGSAADEMEQIMAQLRRASSGGRNGGRSVRGMIDPAMLHAFLGQLGRRGFRGGGAGAGGRRGDELDTDNMTYDELLALGERMGEVKSKGLTKAEIRLLPVADYTRTRALSKSEKRMHWNANLE